MVGPRLPRLILPVLVDVVWVSSWTGDSKNATR